MLSRWPVVVVLHTCRLEPPKGGSPVFGVTPALGVAFAGAYMYTDLMGL
jgi:hypothetical protein